MKRVDLERHLRAHGCEVKNDTGPHTTWINRAEQKTASVPRHREIPTFTARKICADLGIPKPPGK